MPDITCRRCGTLYHADLSHLGKRLQCTQCGSIIVIENQKPAPVSLDASHIQPNQHSPDSPVNKTTASKSRSRWAIYVGAALLITSLAIWGLQPRPQRGVMNEGSHAESRKPQQGSLHESVPEQSNSLSRTLPPDTERNAASDPLATAPNHQSLATSSSSAPSLDPRPKKYHSLPNGARLGEDIDISGHGELSISNQTSLDAVVRLYNRSTLETVCWFFVKAHGSFTVNSIPEGDYSLAYSSGLDWVDSEDSFRWNPSYHEFEKAIIYSELRDNGGIQYDQISITLHPVMGGNVRSKSISRSEFLKGHRHVPL